MGRIIIAKRHGDRTVEWDPRADTEEGRAAVRRAEEIIAEARAKGCAISRKEGTRHVLDRNPFDPQTEEYQIIAPIEGG